MSHSITKATPVKFAKATADSKHIVMTCEVSPGKKVPLRLPREVLSTYGLVKLSSRPDGSQFPLLKTWSRHVRLTDDLPERLGLDIDHSTLRVLCYSGLVKCSRPTPFTTLIDMHSLLEHMEATEGENAAEFWTDARRLQYRQAYHSSGLRLRMPPAEASADQLDLFNPPTQS